MLIRSQLWNVRNHSGQIGEIFWDLDTAILRDPLREYQTVEGYSGPVRGGLVEGTFESHDLVPVDRIAGVDQPSPEWRDHLHS